MLAKFLGKSTLFHFSLRWLLEYCNVLPIARAQDSTKGDKLGRLAQNRATFRAAIAAMKESWPVVIFPEGGSLERPGLVLPLKPGVAKLAFAAEEASDFALGLRVIPVGLEYGNRTRVGSGLYIRYGKPILVRDFKDRFELDEDRAVRELMAELTAQLIASFPHFEDETKAALGKKLVILGIMENKFEAAQLFLRKKEDAAFWNGLEEKKKAFVEASSEYRIPVPAWGHRNAWIHLGAAKRAVCTAWVFAGLPIFFVDLLNNSLPEFILSSAAEFLATDETERMSFRLILSPLVIFPTYALQFWLLRNFLLPGEWANAGIAAYLMYTAGGFLIWFTAVHWRRQFKRLASAFFFWRAGWEGRTEAVQKYSELRDYLRQF